MHLIFTFFSLSYTSHSSQLFDWKSSGGKTLAVQFYFSAVFFIKIWARSIKLEGVFYEPFTAIEYYVMEFLSFSYWRIWKEQIWIRLRLKDRVSQMEPEAMSISNSFKTVYIAFAVVVEKCEWAITN